MARRDDAEAGATHPEHPLFPIEEGQKSFEVSYISITRKDGGAMIWIPQMFRAEELTNINQILELYGGGTYELFARSQSRTNVGQAGHITKRRLLTLPGKPKPIDPSNATPQEEIAAGLRPNPFDQPKPAPGIMGGDGGLLVAILQMSQQSAQAASQQSQQFMALMMQMMNEGKKEAAETSRMMMQMFTQMTTAQQTSMMQMLPLLMGNKGGGPTEMKEYLELFKSFQKPAPAEPSGDDEDGEMDVGKVLSDVATIVQNAPHAIASLKDMASGGPPNGSPSLPVAMPTDAPPGSAASVLAGKG